jgi:hypothetical protein
MGNLPLPARGFGFFRDNVAHGRKGRAGNLPSSQEFAMAFGNPAATGKGYA